jgi:SNF2 family DNA or RNA helicase
MVENLGDAPEEKVIRDAVGRPSLNSEFGGPTQSYALNRKSSLELIAQMAATGRLLLRNNNRVDLKDCKVLHWDERPAQFSVRMEQIGDEWKLQPRFDIPDMEPMETVTLASPTGLMISKDRICPVDFASGYSWVQMLNRRPDFRVPVAQEQEFASEVTKLASSRAIALPEHLRFKELHPAPVPGLRLKFDEGTEEKGQSRATLEIHYGDTIIARNTPAVLQDAATRTLTHRDMEREAAIREELTAEGFKVYDRYGYYAGIEDDYQIKTARLAGALSNLIKKQWRIESQGRPFRTAGDFSAKLTTGIDWFELEAELNFEGIKVRLPELLKALAKGNTMVSLSDGSIGLLPDEFLARYGGLLSMAKADGDQVTFSKSQAGILDVLLHDLPEIKPDERLSKIREGIQQFSGIAPDEQPAGFTGELRGYQREGLAWMRFLEGIDLGGCLADDMGVGKTPQVLALLERRRTEGHGPSLVVVPRSLIFNWKEEAARFTPSLKVLDYSHAERDKTGESFGDYNLVLTTYGTLLRDITALREFAFDYAILDEAQAIKNSGSESAKAARLINARHRMVMTGTPIENHLGELWSLFEFLNPGMLGSLSVFQAAGKALRSIDEANRAMLARALRPFILRRTKGQVAKELPDRIEQTIHCELEGKQKQLYTELRDFYRAKLLGKAGKDLQKTKFQVLEALLRLRQAACHPALIDAKHAAVPSSKLDTLMERLEQVIGEGHKALVFSQFTSFLDLVRKRFHRAGIQYEYLDGATANRQAHVKAFQDDKNCSVFLISLKAGGVGLNLTAAEYVFLLDPWWNPAAEAQAIDRAHRIGQTRTVVASRLIAQGTVEERVLELQRSKRELAEAIIGEDNRLVGNLQREDLELLLS